MTHPRTGHPVTGNAIHHVTLDIPALGGIAIDAELFVPDDIGPFPAAVLLTDIRGVRPVFADIARTLAEQGYAVLLPNLYYRFGRAPLVEPNWSTQQEPGRSRMAELRASVTRDAVQEDFAAILAALRGRADIDATKVGVVGYCMSGAISLWLAADFPHAVAAAASIHGGRLVVNGPDSPHLLADKIGAQLYFGHADNDATIPAEAIRELERTLAAAGCRFTSETYTGAAHGFAVADNKSYQPGAAQRHQAALAALLGEALGGR